jgi:outer membrane lipoprotein LolB
MTLKRRFWIVISPLFAINLIAGCAINKPADDGFIAINEHSFTQKKVVTYQGRLSLRVASDPPQSLYAVFNLNGDAQTGELTLSTPLGSTIAQLSWTPKSAVLTSNNQTKTYSSTNELIENATGTALPLSALLDWLAGQDTPVVGWDIDLSLMKNEEQKRLIAKRTFPLPAADLRIIVDK